MKTRHLVIVGGGFGGLTLALKLRKAPVRITLIDKTNHNLFQPLLYQVAIGALSPGDIATPFRNLVYKQQNLDVVLGEVSQVSRSEKQVHLTNGRTFDYDTLVLAPGTGPSYFGHPEWETHAPGLKTLNDALRIRERLFLAFEKASQLQTPAQRAPYLSVVVIGGGATGVEVAGSIAEIMRRTVRHDFRNIDREELRVVLIEGSARLLNGYHEKLSARALRDLKKLGVEVHLSTFVEDIQVDRVVAGGTTYPTQNAVWAAGNAAEALLASLETSQDKSGRVLVTPHLHLPNDKDVFVIGDAACPDGEPLPGVAQVALQQGAYLAKRLRRGTLKSGGKAFRYKDLGSMATIGRAKAVVEFPNGWKLAGFLAWLIWAVIHVVALIAGRNRFRVFAEWIYYYVTFHPGARLLYTPAGQKAHFDAEAAPDTTPVAETPAIPLVTTEAV